MVDMTDAAAKAKIEEALAVAQEAISVGLSAAAMAGEWLRAVVTDDAAGTGELTNRNTLVRMILTNSLRPMTTVSLITSCLTSVGSEAAANFSSDVLFVERALAKEAQC